MLFRSASLSLGAALLVGAAEPVGKPERPVQGAGSEFEQLANIKVTSVSRTESNVQQSPAAITVLTQEDIRRSGATSIPELLRMVPGLELREMAESAMCCGSGALYNVSQPEESQGLRTRKVRNAAKTEAQVIVTANPGCYIQLKQGVREQGANLQVIHIADLLDQAYGGPAKK